MTEFSKIFRKVNGVNVIKQYAREHVLLYALTMSIINGVGKKSLEILRLGVSNKIVRRLRKKYRGFINEYLDNERGNTRCNSSTESRKVIWMGWLQGLENAPNMVKICNETIRKYICDREIVLITEKNYRDYVTLPDYVIKKAQKGIIPKAHFMDLIRLELLEKYGGTWIDATVYLTGPLENYIFDSDLFLYQNMKPGLDGHPMRISNWFITSKPNEPILKLTMALLYEYWRDYNRLVDYYIFHDMFELAIEAYPSIWKRIVPVSNSIPHILTLRINDIYDERMWNMIKGQTSVHKLTYKRNDYVSDQDTYYYRIINRILD